MISHPINTDPTTLQYSANQTDVSSPIPTSTQVLEPNPASVAVTNVIHPTIEQQLTPTPITQPVTQVIPQEPQIQQLVQEIQPSPVQQIQNLPIAQTPTEVIIPVSPRSPEISSQQIPAPLAGIPEQVASVQA